MTDAHDPSPATSAPLGSTRTAKGAYDSVASPASGQSQPTKPGQAPAPAAKPLTVTVNMPATRPARLAGPVILSGKWTASLFDCFDFCVPNCFMATFCPCVSIAQIATRVGLQYSTVLLAVGVVVGLEYLSYGLLTATRIALWANIAFVLNAVLFIMVFQLRINVRQQFELPGSCIEDVFVSWCCACCSIAQMATHVKSYTPGSCGFGPPDELPAYDAGK